MKRWINMLAFLLLLNQLSAQDKLPLKEQLTTTDKPFVFLVSGDGGVKGFTASLCTALHDRGYSIASLDAHAYFWDKKTPEQTASAIAGYLTTALQSRTNHHWVMIGYSFGADITPFVVNRLPDSLKNQLTDVVLLSPSTSTDFEIHLSDMLGIGKKRSMDVVAEINRLGNQKTAILFGEDESGFPVSQIKLAKYHSDVIKGGHHFDGNFQAVAEKITTIINNK
ncbi:MAG TPA: AcvB/VirJ family lysyl-phosphatidylglycerol hydrolase [Chitinophagaceae bacterium]|nr:AcvB/VirJ family lysyl-phosphatidylglycerol hydrolase [Chitinophagaceae bacterium]